MVTDAAEGVLANDQDAEQNVLTATLVTEPAHGSVTVQADGSLRYEPAPDYFGSDSFTYIASDGHEASGPATVHLDVLPVNDLPVTAEDFFLALPGRTLNVPSHQGVLANDSDVEGSELSAVLADAPEHGNLTLATDGSFTYLPRAGFEGEDRFVYQASDAADFSERTQVTISVSALPLAISEFMAANSTTLTTRTRLDAADRFRGDAEALDWIEIHNLLTHAINIGGMHLSDDPDNLTAWTIPAGTVLPADGRLVVYASAKDIRDPSLDENGLLHTNFKLSADGEYLSLANPQGVVLHDYAPSFPPQVVDVSYGLAAGGLRYFDTPTPGAANGTGLMGIVPQPQIDVEHGFFEEPFQVAHDDGDGRCLRSLHDGRQSTDRDHWNRVFRPDHDQRYDDAARGSLPNGLYSFERQHTNLHLPSGRAATIACWRSPRRLANGFGQRAVVRLWNGPRYRGRPGVGSTADRRVDADPFDVVSYGDGKPHRSGQRHLRQRAAGRPQLGAAGFDRTDQSGWQRRVSDRCGRADPRWL